MGQGQTPVGVVSKLLSSTPMVVTIDLDGKNLREIGAGALPRWSPDGKKILFSAITLEDAGTGPEIQMCWTRSQLCIMDADGKNPHPIAGEGTFDGTFSPDGKKIAFVNRPQRGAITTIVVSHVDGSDPQSLAIAGAACSTPRWLAAAIAFERQNKAMPPYAARQPDDCVWIMNADGGGLHRASHDSGTGRVASMDFDAQRLASLLKGKPYSPLPDDPRYKSLQPGQKIVFEGTKVFIRDASGHRTAAPDGDYRMFDGSYIMHVRGGNHMSK